jgi:hypothetical protein
LGCSQVSLGFTAANVDLVAASREVQPGRLDLQNRCQSTSILPEWTFGEAEPSSYGNTFCTPGRLLAGAGLDAFR